MSTPYTEDCISLTGIFGEPVGFPIFTDYRHTALRLHEHGSGMKAGEMIKDVYGPGNYLYLQRDFGARAFFSGQAFVPLDEILQAMTDMYRNNQQRTHENRARIKINIDALECKFVATTMSQPLFLRHPITGTITKHEHPYPAFPTIRLRTADPIIVATKACCQFTSYTRRPHLALLEQLSHEQNQFFRNPPPWWFSQVHHPAAPKLPLISAPPSAIASTMSPSNCVVRPVMSTTTPAGTHHPRLRKRQRNTAASEEFGPTKRPRGAPCIPPRRNPPRAARTMARETLTPSSRRRRAA